MNEKSNNDEVTLKSFLKRNSYRGRSSFRDRGYRPRRPETAGQATKDEISFVALSSAVCRNESKFTKFILDSGTTVYLMKASMEKYMSNIEMLQEGVTIGRR